MKPSGKPQPASRAAAKSASRKSDRERLQRGESPQVLQRENSIFPEGFFKGACISNLDQAIGR